MAARFLSSLVNCLHVSIPEDVEFLPLFPLLTSSQFNHFKYRFNRFINRKETRHKCGLRCIYYCVNNIYIIPEHVECIQTFWTDGSCILFNNLKKKIINLKLNKTSTLITRITTKKLGYEYIPFAAFSLNPAISPTLSKFKRAKYANWKTLRRFLTLLKVKNVNETGEKKKKENRDERTFTRTSSTSKQRVRHGGWSRRGGIFSREEISRNKKTTNSSAGV